jgi:hypothetical protein
MYWVFFRKEYMYNTHLQAHVFDKYKTYVYFREISKVT